MISCSHLVYEHDDMKASLPLSALGQILGLGLVMALISAGVIGLMFFESMPK